MKNAFKFKRIAVLPVAVLAFAATFFQFRDASAVVETSWGPQDRPTYTWDSPADHITFNSITDNPNIGDERNFVRVRKVGDTGYNTDVLDLEVGQEYEVFVYYHNDASASLNASGKGIASGVRMRSEFPSVLNDGEDGVVTAYISAADSDPKMVWDTAFLRAHGTVYLNFVPNSAVIHNGGSSNGTVLSGDAMLGEEGITLAYWNDMWGMVPGCNEYGGYVTYRIKVDQPNFEVDKKVALSEMPDNYKDEIITVPGDTLNFRINYKNTGTTEQTGVTVHDLLPDGLTYITGTTFAGSTRHPEGSQSPEVLFTEGLGLGAMIAGEEAWVTYQAKLSDSQEIFPCGDTEIYNASYIATNDGRNSDKTKIIVRRTCESSNKVPSTLPTTGPGEIVMAVIIVLVIGGGGFYFYKSRKMLKKVTDNAGDGNTMNTEMTGDIVKDSIQTPIKEDKK
ncbi:DUF11 domain-containing protein [Candidatus Saccharibacteria bacterium]|nr:DUF11 domain-containing protein [Candidatus Saccharibacteria bacterium]